MEVESYKYLGTVIDNKLKGSANITKISKKANQRLYFVRKLRKIKVDKSLLTMFYRSTVESIITFCILSWYGNSSSNDRNKLKKIIKSARKLGCNVTSLHDMYTNALAKKTDSIMNYNDHPLNVYFNLLPSGSRLSSIYARTSRYKNTFVPSAIRLYNDSTL